MNWFPQALDVLYKLEATDEAISNAMRLLYRLDRKEIRQPSITQMPDGGVQIEWGIGDYYLEITCFENYGYFWRVNGTEDGGVTPDPVAIVLDYFERVK